MNNYSFWCIHCLPLSIIDWIKCSFHIIYEFNLINNSSIYIQYYRIIVCIYKDIVSIFIKRFSGGNGMSFQIFVICRMWNDCMLLVRIEYDGLLLVETLLLLNFNFTLLYYLYYSSRTKAAANIRRTKF